MITLPKTGRSIRVTESQFNPELLQIARFAEGLTQKQLADRLGIGQNTLSRWENGLRVPSADEVERVAECLCRPASFLYRPERVLSVDAAMMFHRKRSCTKQSVLQRLHARINIARLAVIAISKQVEPWDVNLHKIPIDECKSPVEAAQKLRQAWRIPRGPIRDLIGLVESAGAVVFEFEFGTPDVDAVGLWHWGDMPLMFVNSSAPADRLRFNIAHELAHLVMHEVPTDTMEDEANAFAGEFLFPEKSVRTEAVNLKPPEIWRLKRRWRVSGACVVRQAFNAKMINQSRYRSLNCYFTQRGWKKREPVEIEREQGAFLRKIIGSFQTVGIDDWELQEILGASDDEMSSVFGIGRSSPNLKVFGSDWRPKPR